MRNGKTVAIAAVLALSATGAWAQESQVKGRWSFTAYAGPDLAVSGDVHDGGSGVVLALPTNVASRSYADIYGQPLRFRLEMGYGISERVELLADLVYSKKSAEEQSVGDVAGLDLRAAFDEYEEMGWSLGARYYFTADGNLRPFAAGWATMSRLETNAPTFSVPAAGVTLADTPFYDESIILGGGVDLGFQYFLSRHVALGASAGLRYQTGPKELEGLAGTGLEALNDVGSRWYAPVGVTFTLRF